MSTGGELAFSKPACSCSQDENWPTRCQLYHIAFTAKPNSCHVHSSLRVTLPTFPCPTLSTEAEPARQHRDYLFCAVRSMMLSKVHYSYGLKVCMYVCMHVCMYVCMAAVRFDCKSNMVGTGLANSHPGCMSRLRKCYSHFLGGSFLAGKASWAPSGCLPTESADYCILVNEWTWLRSGVCLL